MNATTDHSPGKNLLNIGLGDLLSRILAFIAFAYIARILGPGPIGMIGVGASVVGLLSPVVDFGLGFIGTREVSAHPERLASYLRSIFRARLLLSCCSVLLICLGTILTIGLSLEAQIVLLSSLSLIAGSMSLTWAHQGVGKTGWFFLEKNAQAALYLIFCIVLVQEPEDAIWVPILVLISSAIPNALILWRYFAKYTLDKSTSGAGSIPFLLRTSFSLFMPLFISSISRPLSVLLVGTISTIESAGIFSTVARILRSSLIFPNMLWSSFYPSIAAADSAKHGDRNALMSLLLKYTTFLGCLPGVVGVLYAEEIVAIVFGPAFSSAALPLRLVSLAASAQFFSIVFTRIMPALRMESTFRRIHSWAIGVLLLASVVLIPSFGATGASAAILLSESLIAAFAVYRIRTYLTEPLHRYLFISVGILVPTGGALRFAEEVLHLPSVVSPFLLVVLFVAALVAGSHVKLTDFRTLRTSEL